DYSAAYVALETDHPDGVTGHGLTFTIGRGTEVCVAAIEALTPHVVGATVEELVADLGGFWRRLVTDSQLRWLGPEKGVIHLATGALVNAVWDLYARLEGKPLWKLLSDLTPEELVGCVDFSYIEDALTREEALALLRRNAATRSEREAVLVREGFPAYTTSAGWIGYAEDTLPERARAALAAGHHLRRLDRLRGGHAPGARTGGARGGVHAPEAEGRRRPRGRPPAGPDRARGRRARCA